MAESTITHLSIGEVLGLLLEEFPDVTISKIRFLESQGLIAPERTPSGYRKFYDDDVDLLRLILRQQREHFLPLRVIKDRIDSGELEPPRQVSPNHPAARAATRADAPASPSTPAPSMAAGPSPADELEPTDALERPVADTSTTDTTTTAGAATASSSASTGATAEGQAEPKPSSPSSPPTEHAEPEAAAPADPAADHAENRPGSTPETPSAPPRLLPGVVLSRDELCAMAQITAVQLAQLEEFGLLPKRKSGDRSLYGDDAVEIAAAAGGFLRAGVDARHLRAWRTSVEREVGLFEQLLMPTLRQRHPEARSQAAAQLEQLNELGTKLRAALTRAAVRQYVDL